MEAVTNGLLEVVKDHSKKAQAEARAQEEEKCIMLGLHDLIHRRVP